MRIYFIAGLLALIGLSSCLTIIKPLTTPGNIVTDDRVIGQWVSSDSKNFLVQNFMNSRYNPSIKESGNNDFTQDDSLFFAKSYVISNRENNLNYSWIAGLIKIKNHFYINLSPIECLNDQNKDAYDIGSFTTLSIARLDWKNNNEFSLRFLNGDEIKKIILKGNARIAYEYDPLFDTFVITASSEELEGFLEKYGENEILYRGGNIIDLVRKK